MKKILKLILLLVFDLSAYYLSLYLAFLTRKFLSVSILKDIDYNYTFSYLLSFLWIPIIFYFSCGMKNYIQKLSILGWD